MNDEISTAQPAVERPLTDLTDQRVIQMLATEHWSQLSSRSLAYNEAFVRGGMFLTFLSMSFVALALLSSGMNFNTDFLIVAAVVLLFDVIIGLTTFLRISGANADDLVAVRGMARIRHAYLEVAPVLDRYFIAPSHDDIDSLLTVYGDIGAGRVRELVYGLSTSGGMIGLITSMVAGVLGSVVALLAGVGGGVTILIGVATAAVFFGLLVWTAFTGVAANQARLTPIFPAPGAAPEPSPATREG